MPGKATPRFQCGFTKSDGTICESVRMKGNEWCRHHKPETRLMNMRAETCAVPKMKMESIDDIYLAIGDTVNRIRSGELPPKQAQPLAALYGVMLKAHSIKLENDPGQIAKREFTAETARQLAQSITIEQAREILSGRNDKAMTALTNGPVAVAMFTKLDELEKLTEDKAA